MNQFKNNRRFFLSALLSCIVLACTLAYACNKKHNNTAAPADTARNFFTSLANQESTSAEQTDPAKQVRGIKPRVTPLTSLSANIAWNKAVEHQLGDITYTLIPLNEDIKPFNNKEYEFFRNLVFYRDRSKKENLVIVEVLSRKGESLGTDLQQIASTAFENKYFSRTNDISGINAMVFFFDAQYTPDGSFELDAGKWKPVRASFRSDLDIIR